MIWYPWWHCRIWNICWWWMWGRWATVWVFFFVPELAPAVWSLCPCHGTLLVDLVPPQWSLLQWDTCDCLWDSPSTSEWWYWCRTQCFITCQLLWMTSLILIIPSLCALDPPGHSMFTDVLQIKRQLSGSSQSCRYSLLVCEGNVSILHNSHVRQEIYHQGLYSVKPQVICNWVE